MANRKVIKSYISLFSLVLIVLVPLFVLYSDVPISRSFSPWPVLLTTLGKLSGLIGLSVFSLSLFLSSRFVWLDKLFYGLPKVINIHRYFGMISFTLIVLHPLFLAIRLLPVSSKAPLGIFLLWSQLAYIFGYLSLLIFMTLVLMTFFWRLQYERLKSLHSLLAVPLMFGGIHSLLIDSDVNRIPFLAFYYIILISLSVLVYLARLFLVDYGLKSKRFFIDSIEQTTLDSVKVVIRPEKEALICGSGQFIFVSFPDIKKGEEHPFSLAEIREDGTLVIIAKSLGDYTAKMSSLKAGSLAMVDGPYGSFGNSADNDCHQVWVAGGIGITPFIGMAQSFVEDKEAKGQVDLFYVVSSEKDLAGLETLKKAELLCPRFKLKPYISSESGRFDLVKLKSFVGDISSCYFYICGPEGMIKSLVYSLRKDKVSSSRINIEAFKLL